MVEVTEQEFFEMIRNGRISNEELSLIISTRMTEMLGEIAAQAALAYTGDAKEGDIRGFLERIRELMGSSSQIMIDLIASQIKLLEKATPVEPKEKTDQK
jgi:hypothetical protein